MTIGLLSQWCDLELGPASPETYAREFAKQGQSVSVLTGSPDYPEGRASCRRSNRGGVRVVQQEQKRRRGSRLEDTVLMAVGIKQGPGDREIGELTGRDQSAIWRERQHNSGQTSGRKPLTADGKAPRRRARPQTKPIDSDPVLSERVRSDLRQSRTPLQGAGRLRLVAREATVGTLVDSPDAEGRRVSHEAIDRWIYPHPNGQLARGGILLSPIRTVRRRREPLGMPVGGSTGWSG